MGGRSLQILFFLWFLQCKCMIVAVGFNPNGRNDKIWCIERERQALLTFKRDLVNNNGKLSSWRSDDEKEDCCKWRGVRCNNKTGHVVSLDLSYNYETNFVPLEGKISSSLLELLYLNYLDLSGNNFNESTIPKFIGSLSNLRYLDLSYANFGGTIPSQLGNLSYLQSLSLAQNFLTEVENLEWLSHLSYLKYLDLSGLNLNKTTNWLQVVTKLRYLTNLQLSSCRLPNIIPKSLSLVNASTSLATLDLSNNGQNSSIYHWLFNSSRSLVDLFLGGNKLKGSIPNAFGNMTSLENLDLFSNQLEGEIPKSLGNLCSLQTFYSVHNNLSGRLTGFIENLSKCKESSLQILDLSYNQITGSLPNLTRLSSLVRLSLKFNLLNGTITESVGQLSKLQTLDVATNSLEGVISEAHFSNLSKLKDLDLSFNSLALDFKQDWVPPFQLDFITLVSCNLGPRFPKWLLTQNNFFHLSISGAEISDSVPSSFWKLSPNLRYLSLSYNQIYGTIANSSPKYIDFPAIDLAIDLSSNRFEGQIPSFLWNAASLNLSENKFSGPISSLCSVTDGKLSSLDLSNNLLSGELPDCWMHVKDLVILNLASNNFFGKIPNSMGFLHSIESLKLRNNHFTGGLPSSLKNCTELKYIDLAENGLSGTLPIWIGDSLPKLVVLILRSNQFQCSMPLHLCYLAYIQLLDLSLNNISGRIPKCLNNLTTLAQKGNTGATISHQFINGHITYYNSALFVWKGGNFEFRNTLGYVKIIDLSSNKLTGEVPREITELVGLVSLNLSRNSLTGQIPPRIGQLTLLDALDLSRNKFYGEVPPSLSQIDRLSVLDLSKNNLSGKIPTGTQLQSFNTSTYERNPGLCGAPLRNKCPGEEAAQVPDVLVGSKNADKLEHEYGFYVSVVLGFVVGFWGVCGTLVVNHSWRYAYFNFLKKIQDWLYVTVVVYKTKLQRTFVG